MIRLNNRAKVIGMYYDTNNKCFQLIIRYDNEMNISHKIFKNKKGVYVKIKEYYIENKVKGRVKNWYFKDNLWWSFNRLEMYINESK